MTPPVRYRWKKRRTCAAVSAWLLGAAILALSGCHHAAVRAVTLPALPPPSDSPVMVSVPPPTHRSIPDTDNEETVSGIPVVKPVPAPKKRSHRTAPTAPPPVAATAAPAPAPAAAQPQASTPTAAETLGQLTTDTDYSVATRDSSGTAVRTQRDRLNGLSASVQAANATQVEQIRRFVKAALDAWNTSDYAAALTLATKARVLLDDLPK